MRVYLCGPINGCSDGEAISWRGWFKGEFSACYVDPMERDYRGNEAEDYREIVELDKRDIRSVDVVVAMFTNPSVGTSMEILFSYSLGIPVIVINESGNQVSPWLRYHATAIVESKTDACSKLGEWF